MIYLSHDIYSNFSASIKSGDTDLTIDIISNEISDLIIFDVDKFIEILTKADILANKGMPDEMLVDLFLQNITINKKLSKTLAFQIADSNGLINSGKSDTKKWVAIVDVMSTGIMSIAKDISIHPDMKESLKKNIMNQIVSKAKTKGNYNRQIFNQPKKKDTTIYWILGSIAVVGIIAYIIYRKYGNEMGDGGSVVSDPALINPNPPQPIINDVQPIQPQIQQPVQPQIQPQIQPITPPITPVQNVA